MRTHGRGAAAPWDVACAAIVLMAAYGAKRFYATATAADLDFILRPTTALVERVTSGHFIRRDEGYVSMSLSTVIAPACAGMNYLVVSFTALSLAFVGRVRTPIAKLGFIATSAGLSYAATLAVNAVRIALGIALHERGFSPFGATPSEVHRIEGVLVYLGSLLISFSAMDAFLSCGRPARSLAVPVLVYVAMTLALPIANGAASYPGFWVHAIAVLAVAATMLAVFEMSRLVRRSVTS